MNINEINYWPCTWFKEERPFGREDFLAADTEFFIFGKSRETPFLMANRGDVAMAFYKRFIDNIEEEIFITDEYGFLSSFSINAKKQVIDAFLH